jgi:hypothetical protein
MDPYVRFVMWAWFVLGVCLVHSVGLVVAVTGVVNIQAVLLVLFSSALILASIFLRIGD